MNSKQEERLVVAWEELARGLGELNEIARIALSKQWPETRERRDAIITKLPTAEDKIKKETGNSDGPIDEWLGEFDAEEEIGPREKEFLASQGKQSNFTSRPKAPSKAGGQGAAGA